MYKAPIEIVAETLMQEEWNHVLRTVREVRVDVDKGELLKALRYDRHQYQAGYNQARMDYSEWANIKEDGLPEEEGKYLIVLRNRKSRMRRIALARSHCGDDFWLPDGDESMEGHDVTHWMYKPELPMCFEEE